MMHEVCCLYTHTLREGLQNHNFEYHLLLLLLLLSNESLSSQHM